MPLDVMVLGGVGENEVTMTSLELVEFINSLRGPGEPELRHDSFMAKVPKVLGDQSPKFIGDYKDSRGRTYPCYRFPKREACLMAMSYSYELQAKVYDYMTALEQQQRAPQTLKLEVAKQSVEAVLGVANLLGVPLHYAQVEAVKMTYAATGVDFSPLLLHSPAQDNISEEDKMLEPTELGELYGLSPVEANRRLAGAGLQIRVDGKWVASDLGKNLCRTHHWVKNGKSGYNYKWKVSAVRHLMGSVE